MKISQDLQTQTIKQVRTNVNGKQSFEKAVQLTTNEINGDKIQGLMRDISAQGDKLARFHSFQDLAKFKRMVKGFLKETIYGGLNLEKSQNFTPQGDSQQLALVKKVDEKLLELTDKVLGEEKDSVSLLGVIGEIKGLLINLSV